MDFYDPLNVVYSLSQTIVIQGYCITSLQEKSKIHHFFIKKNTTILDFLGISVGVIISLFINAEYRCKRRKE